MIFKWLLQKSKNNKIIQQLKKNAGLIPSEKKVNLVSINNFRKSMYADMRNLQQTGFTYPKDITDLPLSRLSNDAKEKILQIVREDLDRQYKKIDDGQLKINFD